MRRTLFVNKGQSLLEVMIIVALVGISIVTLIRVFTASTTNVRMVKERTQAEGMAKETMEWLGYQRDLGWAEFSDRAGVTYCLTTLDDWPEPAVCGTTDFVIQNGAQTVFKREAVLTENGTEVEVVITIGWDEDNQLELKKSFTPWRL